MKTNTASLLIRCNGSMETVNPSNTRKGWSLQELYGHLSCDMVEVVYPVNPLPVMLGSLAKKNTILICDEEALFSSKTVNPFASMLAGQRIVGDVILTESKNLK